MTGKPREQPDRDGTGTPQSSTRTTKLPPQKMVRSDHQIQTLDSFVRPSLAKESHESNPASTRSSSQQLDRPDTSPEPSSSSKSHREVLASNSLNQSAKIEQSVCALGSVHQIRIKIKESTDMGL